MLFKLAMCVWDVYICGTQKKITSTAFRHSLHATSLQFQTAALVTHLNLNKFSSLTSDFISPSYKQCPRTSKSEVL